MQMKKTLTYLTLLLSSVSFFACEKNCEEPKPLLYTVEGYWEGTYTSDQSPEEGENPMSIVFKPDGTILFDGTTPVIGRIIHDGYWTRHGDTVETTADFWVEYFKTTVHQTHTYIFDEKKGTLIGTWDNHSVPAGTGKTNLKKIPNMTN